MHISQVWCDGESFFCTVFFLTKHSPPRQENNAMNNDQWSLASFFIINQPTMAYFGTFQAPNKIQINDLIATTPFVATG
jgi:hypothetical protein